MNLGLLKKSWMFKAQVLTLPMLIHNVTPDPALKNLFQPYLFVNQ